VLIRKKTEGVEGENVMGRGG